MSYLKKRGQNVQAKTSVGQIVLHSSFTMNIGSKFIALYTK